MYFVTISEELAERIKGDTGVDVEGYNCTVRATEIRKILSSHGTIGTESPRGQRAITAEDFVHIPDIIQNPDEIVLAEKLYDNKPVIKFIKSINGKTTVVSYVSQKHMDLTVQTMYSGKNKRSLATTPGEVSPFPYTSETLSGTASDNIIHNHDEKINKKISTDKTYGLQPDSWTAERIKSGKTDKNGTVKTKPISEIIDDIRRDFDINITTGHVRGDGVLGQYNRNDKGVRSRIANDLPTIAHELGHHLDDKYNIIY